MKQKRTLFTGIAIGVLTSFLVSMMVVPGFAAGIRKTITAYVGDIDIYVDNVLKIPTDANGNRVEPMIYDGTTYLPVRAISNMLGEEVTWDGETRSIYIGEKPSKGTVGVPGEDIPRFSGTLKARNLSYEILGEQYNVSNAIQSNSSYDDCITWKLDSNYTSIDGEFVVAYPLLGNMREFTLEFYNVDQYGTETLIKRFSNRCGDGVVDVHVDVTGCNFVRLKTDYEDHAPNGDGGYFVLYDIIGTKYK
ncbi:MAG: copper amine oxidase N-terminal domain-containing protein [Ruminiclostridium sp.]|nr:copper amine oxidase N-terminal domain-containing protein [Ruminiclostridium sp.]